MPPDSSPEDVVVPPTDAETVSDVAPVSSPGPKTPAETPDKGVTMLDTVKAALEPKVATPAAKTPDAPAESDPTDKSKADDELSEDELKQLSEKTQNRFKKLTANLKAKDGEITNLTPKAKEYDNLTSWVQSNNLTPADVRGTLEITGLLKNDPRAALDRLRPIIAQLEHVVGETLPPELQQRVDQGFLTQEDAKALSRANAEAAAATKRAQGLTEQQRQDQAVRDQQAATSQTVSTIETWETAKAKSDPDWHLKQAAITEQVELAILQEVNRRGKPWFPNPTEAVKLSEDALKKVNERYSAFVPKPAAIKPAVGGASTRSAPEPKTMLDVVKQAANA